MPQAQDVQERPLPREGRVPQAQDVQKRPLPRKGRVPMFRDGQVSRAQDGQERPQAQGAQERLSPQRRPASCTASTTALAVSASAMGMMPWPRLKTWPRAFLPFSTIAAAVLQANSAGANR